VYRLTLLPNRDAEATVHRRGGEDRGHIAQTALRGRFMGFLNHGRGQVDTRRLAHMRCEGANHKARTACDIEDGVVRLRRGSLDDQPSPRIATPIPCSKGSKVTKTANTFSTAC
jgi:hypothetical protein